MQKNTLIAISIVLGAGFISLLLMSGGRTSSEPAGLTAVAEGVNVEVRDGVQYVTVTAKSGYSPRISTVQAGIPTKLIMKTKGTFDCSSALVIHAIGYEKMLSPNGEEEIDLGTLSAGDKIAGTCSMGMYNFTVQVAG